MKEAYRILFLAGSVFAILGISLWLPYTYGLSSFYPRFAHAQIMYFAALWAFVAGFMMTAIPKMTGTNPASKFDLAFIFFLLVMQFFVSIEFSTIESLIVYIVQTAFLIQFLVRRFLIFKKVPFSGFVFMPFAFLQIAVGSWIYFKEGYLPYLLLGEAFIMNLMMGLGSRLIPVLSRMPNAISPDIQSKLVGVKKGFLLALLLNISYWVEVSGNSFYGEVLRLAVISFIMVDQLQLFKKPVRWGVMGIGLKAGMIFILLSIPLSWALEVTPVSSKHLLYIGGFLLITIMVGTRVMLAHGGESLEYEIQSKKLMLIALFAGVAALLRLVASADIQSVFMQLSIFIAVFSLSAWLQVFVKILFKNTNSQEPM